MAQSHGGQSPMEPRSPADAGVEAQVLQVCVDVYAINVHLCFVCVFECLCTQVCLDMRVFDLDMRVFDLDMRVFDLDARVFDLDMRVFHLRVLALIIGANIRENRDVCYFVYGDWGSSSLPIMIRRQADHSKIFWRG